MSGKGEVNAASSTTTTKDWSTADDTKLLHLARLMPSQWDEIATLVGRSARDCQERYEGMLPPDAVPCCGDALDVSNNTVATSDTFEDEEMALSRSKNVSSVLMKKEPVHDGEREAGDQPIFMEFADSEGQEKAGVVSRKAKLGMLLCLLYLVAGTMAILVATRDSLEEPMQTLDLDSTTNTTNVTTIAPTPASTQETTEENKPDFENQVVTAENVNAPEVPPSYEVTSEESAPAATAAPTTEQTAENTAAIYPSLMMPEH